VHVVVGLFWKCIIPWYFVIRWKDYISNESWIKL